MTDAAEVRAGAVFGALSDPTRRRVLHAVAARGPVTSTELATGLPVTRQAVAKHLTVLRDAGLVEPRRTGRETRFTARPEALDAASRWLETTGAAWDERLSRLRERATSVNDGERPAP